MALLHAIWSLLLPAADQLLYDLILLSNLLLQLTAESTNRNSMS